MLMSLPTVTLVLKTGLELSNNIFDSDSRLKAADFIRLIYTIIDDEIAAFKFGFSNFAGKVFKQKKGNVGLK